MQRRPNRKKNNAFETTDGPRCVCCVTSSPHRNPRRSNYTIIIENEVEEGPGKNEEEINELEGH